MEDSPTKVSHDGGVDAHTIEMLHLTLSQTRLFLAKLEELGLQASKINFVRLTLCDFTPSARDLRGLDYHHENQGKPFLKVFDRDLVSLHLPIEGQADEGHQYEAVWKRSDSMDHFRPFLDHQWGMNREYGVRGVHRALDQRH